MALSVVTSGTLTSDGTEQTLTTQTSVKRFQVMIDLSAMVNGDKVEIKIKTKTLTGSTAAIAYYELFSDIPSNPVFVSPELTSYFSYAVTLKRVVGSNHDFAWSVNDVGVFLPGSDTVALVTTVTNLTTNNDKTGYSLSAAGVQAIWDALTAALTTVNSIGKLLVDNINATISSRLASASYTTPPTVVQIRQEMDSNSTKLANLDATVSSRSTYAGGAVASVTAAVTVGTNNDKTGYALTAGERTSIADALLDRDMSAGADTVARSVRNALRLNRNKVSIAAGTMTVTKEDDTTTAWTAALTTDAAAQPITTVDPA